MDTNAKVLVIDADEIVLEYYRQALASAKYAVRCAKTSEEALENLAHQVFDVVFLEQAVPGSDGLALLVTIKRLWPNTEVVVITGSGSVSQAKEAIRLGAYDYLVKPASLDEISKAAVDATIQKKWAMHRIPGRDSAQPVNEGELS